MAEKQYLYHRVANGIVRTPSTDNEGKVVGYSNIPVSPFAGLRLAIQRTSLGQNKLIDSLRIMRKLDKASYVPNNPEFDAEYIVFSEAEKNLILSAGNELNWSATPQEVGHTLFTQWIPFLVCFDSEDEDFGKTWIEYDPMNPPVEYVTWKASYEEKKAGYDAAVKAAEAKVVDNATKSDTSGDGADTSSSGDVVVA